MRVNKNKYKELCLLYNDIFFGLSGLGSNQPPILKGIDYLSANKIFKNEKWEKLLICYTDSASLDFNQFEALKKSCFYLKEEFLYRVTVEADLSNAITLSKVPDFDFFNFDYLEYTKDDINRYNDNAIFSDSGKWGLFLAHEDFAVLAGERIFIENFKENYPEWKDGLSNFIEMWEEDGKEGKLDISWMNAFLKNLS